MRGIYKTLSTVVLLCSLQQATAQNFITQWNLATAGSGATQLSFGTATSGTVNYTWQEISPGTASGSGTWSGATLTITGLPTGATIRLQIAPINFQRIFINNGLDRRRLTQVEQWGTTAWTSMQDAFDGCANLQVTATDVPDLLGVINLSEMFRTCSNLNSPSNINTWNTGTITNMSGMFANASAFNQNIGSWNTGSATNMSAMFSGASAFNQNISSWNTGAVTDMSSLFADAVAFNQNIGAWNTAAVTNMAGMFAGAIVFNRNIGVWNTAAVTDMNSMFFSAYAFNQNISGWNIAAVTNMSSMFGYAYNFNQNIGTWNTSAVTNMSRMFEDAFDFNQNIGVWNTSAVTNMRGMFIDAYAFNQNIGTWNTSAVTDMSRMFDFATAFNQNIGAWNTAAVTNMSGMFADASAFNQNIGTWSLNPAVNLTGMFNNSDMDCNNYSATLIGWSTNPSTPNSRTLGAIGRQYGTNAVAARTNLASTKSWTITGDTPSGVVCAPVSAPTPTIANFTPTSGPIGTTVTITGTNFSTTPSNNIVFFGATQAAVSASTSTQLTVTVPAGATYESISVLVNGLTGYSSTPFIVTFADGGVINSCAFAAKVDITTGTEPYSIAIGDLDGDGKADLAVANQISNTISVFRNTSSLGSLTTGSFAPKVDFATNSEPYYVGIRDLDGDGKPELIATNNDSDNVSIYKNVSTSGVINSSSFAAKVDFTTGENPWNATVDDFDLDGKPDLAIVNDVGNTVSILRNTSSKGIINATSFATHVEFATGSFPIGIDSEDLDGDGKIDIVVTNQASTSISVLRNTSTVGSITTSSFAAKVDFPTGLDPYSVAIGDLDANGKPEIIVANYSSATASVFNNTSTSGTIALSAKVDFDSGTSSLMVALNDIDGDGKIDLTVTNGGNRISVLKNINSSAPIIATSFSPRVDFQATNVPYGLAIGDLDGNGKPDVAATNSSGTTVSLLRNTVSSLPSFTATSFSPASGSIGTVVTLTGTNFSATPINNTVKFNGIVATVTASSSTSITAIVPGGATTGPISLEIGCSTAITVLPFTITAGSAITFTTQPSDVVTCAGSIATFTTEATGTINITYQWQKFNGSVFANISNAGEYSGTTTSTLTVNTTGSVGTGDYRCVVTGDNAPVVFSQTVSLTLSTNSTLAEITINGNILTASVGDSYQWYQNDDAVAGATDQSFELNVLEYGRYKVDVTDNGCTSTSVEFEYLITGVENFSDGVKLYPNPVEKILITELHPPYIISIINTSGMIVGEKNSNTRNASIDFSLLSSGLYILQLKNEKGVSYHRITKK